jgi:dienelactone hydrolase
MKSENAASIRPTRYLEKVFDVLVTEGVKFGAGAIDWTPAKGATRFRPLLLDVYEPDERPTIPRPALVLAFGGAFQRGTRKDDVVGEPPHRNTAISEYCRQFARRGYVCFAIDYRLMPETPDPGTTPTWLAGATINVDRANFVRNLLGLQPCTPQMMIEAVEAATDDITAAVSFVRSRCHDLMIDPQRIAVGGFSAGATAAINSAFAELSPVAAVVALSGRMTLQSAQANVRDAKCPPVLMTFGENDLPGSLEDLEPRTRHFEKVGLAHEVVRITGATHFYPQASLVERKDGSRTDLETLIAEFLFSHLHLDHQE